MSEIERSFTNHSVLDLLIDRLEKSFYHSLWRQMFNPLSGVLYAQIWDPLMSQLYERSVDL